MVRLMGVDSNAVLGIAPPNLLFMFPQSDFQRPLCHADVDSVTIIAGDFIHDSSSAAQGWES